MVIGAYKSLSISICLFCCTVGCERRPAATSEAQSTQTPIDPCALLRKDEIEVVQGSPVRENKSSANANNGFRVAQCYYAANENSKSVALTATQRDTEHLTARTAKNVWDDMFGEEAREKKQGEGEREEEGKGAAPKKIDGVGDEAYWTGARFGGALYVLSREKDTFIRVSVGGGDTEEGKIEKSKALARKAFDRL
jgi:hypothetical protein